MGQLDMYAPGKQEEEERQLPNDMDAINALCNQRKNVDFAGRMVWEGDREVFTFGKYKGCAVTDVLHRDPGYYSWMLNSDFTLDTKQALTRIRLREAKKMTK
jgi:DNA polymerase-3 subunit epsilon